MPFAGASIYPTIRPDKPSRASSLPSLPAASSQVVPEAPGRPQKVVCLALGSFSPDNAPPGPSMPRPGPASSTGIHGLKQSQYQLVFLLDVVLPVLAAPARHSHTPDPAQDQQCQATPATERPQKSPVKVCFYDPAVTEKDKEHLRTFGHHVLESEPSLCCEEPTLFYMPHAPKTLYERLVSANSTPDHPDRLGQITLLGNDLKSYQQTMVQEEKDAIPLIIHLDPLTIRTRYPPDLTKLNQDTGVHFFNEKCFQSFAKPQNKQTSSVQP